MAQRKKKWIRSRHKVTRILLGPPIYLYLKLRYRCTCDRFTGSGDSEYLILYNHETPCDQFFVDFSFRKIIYYVASEEFLTMGFISSVIRYLAAPIPIRKQTRDITAVKTCMQIVKEGGSICIAPEGNRTFSGRTTFIEPSIVPFARKLNLPVVLYRIEGGYGAHPRWTDVTRTGRVHTYVSRVITPQEFGCMTDDEFYKAITEGLYVDECREDFMPGVRYRSSRRAENIEEALYVCPDCGLSKFESHKEKFKCTKCGKTYIYGEDKRITGEGFKSPFMYAGDWYQYQQDFINELDVLQYKDEPVYIDTCDLYEIVDRRKKVRRMKRTKVCLYGDRLTIGDKVYEFGKIPPPAVQGGIKLQLSIEDGLYQIKGSKSFNAVKYLNFYYRYRNMTKGDGNGKFLGL